jgi:hypothetical protein
MKCDWERHLTRHKHINSHNGNEGNQKNRKKLTHVIVANIFYQIQDYGNIKRGVMKQRLAKL